MQFSMLPGETGTQSITPFQMPRVDKILGPSVDCLCFKCLLWASIFPT